MRRPWRLVVGLSSALREAIARVPGSGRAHYTLARLFQRRGRQAEALNEFRASLAFTPLVGVNGIYQSMGALAAARQDFDTAVAVPLRSAPSPATGSRYSS